MDDRYIVEGRIIELRLLTYATPGGRFRVALDVDAAWARAYPPRPVSPEVLASTTFYGPARVASPGLKPGDRVRLVARVDGAIANIEELAVMNASRRFVIRDAPLAALAHESLADR